MNLKKKVRPAIAVTALLGSISGGMFALAPIHAATNPDQAAVLAAAVGDVGSTVDPVIPCDVDGQTKVLTDAVRQTRKADVALHFQQTYAPTEPTHARLLSHLQDLVDRFGLNSSAMRSGYLLCSLSGGVDQVQVVNFTQSTPTTATITTPTTATITIQAHIWNETVGVSNGVPFHYKPQSVIQVTDDAVKTNGQWLISQRGVETFVSGAP